MSGNEEETIDSASAVRSGLGALFGMVLGNLALVVVALIIRRVTRSRNEKSKGNMVLKNGKRKAPSDVEVGNPMYDYTIRDNSRTSDRPRSTDRQKSSSGHSHVNDGFEEIDLDQDDVDSDVRLYEAAIRNEKEEENQQYASLDSTGLDTRPDEPSDGHPENNYSAEQSDDQSAEHSDDHSTEHSAEQSTEHLDKHVEENPDEHSESSYENVGRKSKTKPEEHSEADVCY